MASEAAVIVRHTTWFHKVLTCGLAFILSFSTNVWAGPSYYHYHALASDSAFRRAQAIAGERLGFSDILALQAILRALDEIAGISGPAQRKKIFTLNKALANSRLKVSPILRTVRVGPHVEKVRAVTIYLNGNPWKEAYLGWDKLSAEGLHAIGMRSAHTAWLTEPATRKVFVADSVEAITPLAGAVYQINAMAFGTQRRGAGVRVGGIRYFRRHVGELVKKGYKNIYLVGLLPIGKLVRCMERGEWDQWNHAKGSTPFYTVRDKQSGATRMVIWQMYNGGDLRQFNEGSPFSSENPRDINPRWGTLEELQKLAEELRSQDVRLTVDVVPNHIGIDNPWLIDNWDATVHRDPHKDYSAEELEHKTDEELIEDYRVRKLEYFVFYRIPGDKKSRIMIAHGRDPNFAGWVNSVQLDYTSAKARQYVLDTMRFWASRGFSIRADMANLVTREAFKHHWYPHMTWKKFDELWPLEKDFWVEVKDTVMKEYPDLVLMMEAYGNTVGYLAPLHPRYAVYDEQLIKLLESKDVGGLKKYLRDTPLIEMQRRFVHYQANHDIKSATERFGPEFQKMIAVFLATIPGIPFVYDRETQGFFNRLSVQQWFPPWQESADPAMQPYYDREVAPLQPDPLYRAGGIYVLDSDNPHLLAFTRTYKDRESLVVLNISGHPQNGALPMGGYPFRVDLPAFGHQIWRRDVPEAAASIQDLKQRLDALGVLAQAA